MQSITKPVIIILETIKIQNYNNCLSPTEICHFVLIVECLYGQTTKMTFCGSSLSVWMLYLSPSQQISFIRDFDLLATMFSDNCLIHKNNIRSHILNKVGEQ